MIKLNIKQKQFKRLYDYTIINHNGVTCSFKKDGTLVPATLEELELFLMFTPTGIIQEIKEDINNLIEIVELKHKLFRRWQMMVLCDAKSQLNNGQKFFVLTDVNGHFKISNRDGFKMLKTKGFISKRATFMDIEKEAIYISGTRKKNKQNKK